jgi:hypothetical protein
MPLGIDLFCGLGGWTEGLLSEGYDVVGFDNERHVYGDQHYPAQLVLQDVLTLHGSQFRNAALIVASPPCQAYSYMAQPWRRAKREISWQKWARSGSPFAERFSLDDLFNACFRIQREASKAAGYHIPLVVENVKGAQPWVGRAAWHYGSFYLWGDVPALMPSTRHLKVAGFNFHQQEKTGKPGGSFQLAAVEGVKQHGSGAAWFDKPLDERRKHAGVKVPNNKLSENGFTIPVARLIDKSTKPAEFKLDSEDRRQHLSYSRKAASAQIAKIPFELARWIAYCYR